MLVKQVPSPRKSQPIDGPVPEQAACDVSDASCQAAALAQRPLVPGLYYGWVMLALAMLLAIASSPGQTFGVSIFIEPMRIDLGLTHGQIGLAYTLGTILGAGPILWIGHMVDRLGLRPIAICVVIVFGCACLFMACVQNWFQIVIAFTLLRMLGPGALSLISSNILPFWFSRRLGTVEGYRQTAMAVAMGTVPPLNLWLVYQFGWRIGYAILGAAIVSVLGVVVWRWFRSSPEELRVSLDGSPDRLEPLLSIAEQSSGLESYSATRLHSMSLAETVRTATFWIVLAGTSLFGVIQTGLFFCLTPIFQELQMDEGMAATLLASFAVSLAGHQVIGGRLADQFDAKWLLVLGMLAFTLGLTVLSRSSTAAGIVFAGLGMGAAQGLYFAAAQPLWARYYGTCHLGKLRGLLMATNVATSSLGPLLVGSCFDYCGSFMPVLHAFPMMPLVLAALSLCVRRPVARYARSAST